MREAVCGLIGMVVLALVGPVVVAASKPADYLTKDGKLRHKLEVADLQGGFAGFVGPKTVIDPSGKWTVFKKVGARETEERTGQLNKAQRAALAKELARYDLLTLKNIGKPSVNPHNVSIAFGKVGAELKLGAGAPLPKPSTTGAGRFAGILAAVNKAVGPKDKGGTEK
jgi:hypothetical protein